MLSENNSSNSILVAEDDKATREVMAIILTSRYHDAATDFAGNGGIGAELFRD
jgi:CheY-like chemotaxis protein